MRTSERDVELVRALVETWSSTRAWAEQLLVESLGLGLPSDILEAPHRGKRQVPNTLWWYRTHGAGVEITQPGNVGGIDFDFDKSTPEPWRLRDFLVKQFNAGSLTKRDYRPLVQDEIRWSAAVDAALGLGENDA